MPVHSFSAHASRVGIVFPSPSEETSVDMRFKLHLFKTTII